jgi:hypothetical protein
MPYTDFNMKTAIAVKRLTVKIPPPPLLTSKNTKFADKYGIFPLGNTPLFYKISSFPPKTASSVDKNCLTVGKNTPFWSAGAGGSTRIQKNVWTDNFIFMLFLLKTMFYHFILANIWKELTAYDYFKFKAD